MEPVLLRRWRTTKKCTLKRNVLCIFRRKKIRLVDLQGSMFKLYDPEISTSEFTSDRDESYFCAGNLSHVSIDNFFKAHECNKYCEVMELKD